MTFQCILQHWSHSLSRTYHELRHLNPVLSCESSTCMFSWLFHQSLSCPLAVQFVFLTPTAGSLLSNKVKNVVWHQQICATLDFRNQKKGSRNSRVLSQLFQQSSAMLLVGHLAVQFVWFTPTARILLSYKMRSEKFNLWGMCDIVRAV